MSQPADDSPFCKKDDLNTSGEWLTTTKPPKASKKSKAIASKSPTKYQNIDSQPQLPSSSTTVSSLNLENEGPSKENLPDPWEKLVKELCSPTFQEEHKSAALKVFDRDKERTTLKDKCVPVRNAEARATLMHGYECRCCAPYYDALNLTPGERQRRINQVSRHRGFQPIPSTPERYWDIEFPTTQEQRNLGLVVETDSPLFKTKPKRSVSRNDRRKAKRELTKNSVGKMSQPADDSPFCKKDDLNTSGEWLTTTKPPKASKKSKAIASKSPTKYQNIDSQPQLPSSSTTVSSLNLENEGPSKENLPDPWEKLVKELCSPTFQEEHKSAALKVFDRDKERTTLKDKCVPVRNAEARATLMHGYECRCCAPYYDALNLTPGERQRRINQVSRHRGFQPIPSTPERYWDIEFPTTQEQRNLGLVVETDSPLFKTKPKRSVSRNDLHNIMASLEELKAKFDEEVNKISQLEKDRSRCLLNRRQLESQLTENNMVKEEFDRLEVAANVYKLIGPVLVKQDLAEAKENVRKRVEYITTEISRVESVLADFAKNIESQKLNAEKARDILKANLAKAGA
ncbi:prefoldin subunit domain-containing protein [Ditylenchus destructor]|uniref:Probable prefoldin subunit 6 n=1 Tax=Ditylenchus destructor TaxID=166010 RepID=A0AAD4NBF9_9BILA|nr:prefoldin subunit domain-containing protein [Ditylenchus destructor]